MNASDIGQLAYLVLLGAAVVGWFIAQNRRNLGKTAQQAALWGLIFVGFIAAVGLWGDIRNSVMPRQSLVANGQAIEVPRSPDGHYYLTLKVNGTPVRFVVDTGASDVVLTKADAKRVGIDPSQLAYVGTATTANGVVRTAPVRLDSVGLGDLVARGVRASVNGGQMQGSLLGMSYLQRFGKIEISGNKMILRN